MSIVMLSSLCRPDLQTTLIECGMLSALAVS
jgi:hypothetical protein